MSLVKNALESSEERYSSDSGNTIYKRHGGSSSLTESCIDDFLTNTSPIVYDNMAKDGEKHAPKIYSSTSYNEFKHVRIAYDEIDNALITAYYDDNNSFISTIEQGAIKYDSKKDLYTIEFDVNISDDSEALANGHKNLSTSIGSDVSYRKQHQTILIWGSGLFCYYHTENIWATSLYNLQNDYNKYFTYNKDNVEKLIIPADTSWTSSCKLDAKD